MICFLENHSYESQICTANYSDADLGTYTLTNVSSHKTIMLFFANKTFNFDLEIQDWFGTLKYKNYLQELCPILPGSRDRSGKRNGLSNICFSFFKILCFKKGILFIIFCHRASWFMANLWLDHDIISLLNFGLRGIRMFLIYSCLFHMFKTYEQQLLIQNVKSQQLFKSKVCLKSKPQSPVKSSVADPNPDPDPSDPYVFGPPGSGSGSGSFYQQAKTGRKTLIPTVL
jgi:hypothetical protein